MTRKVRTRKRRISRECRLVKVLYKTQTRKIDLEIIRRLRLFRAKRILLGGKTLRRLLVNRMALQVTQ